MAMYIKIRLYFSRALLILAFACFWGAANAVAEQLPSAGAQQTQYGGYLAWNTSEPYWINQYVGVGVEQREFVSLNKQQNGLTSTNVVIETQLFDRLILSGNAGYLSWSDNTIIHSQQLTEPSVYWGLSTSWRLNRRIDLKAQWQQTQSGQKEQLLLMGIDVKLNF